MRKSSSQLLLIVNGAHMGYSMPALITSHRPCRGAKFCDRRVCLYVCLYVAYLKYDTSKVHEMFFSCYLWLWLGSVLTTMIELCTSGFVDDVIRLPIMDYMARGYDYEGAYCRIVKND